MTPEQTLISINFIRIATVLGLLMVFGLRLVAGEATMRRVVLVVGSFLMLTNLGGLWLILRIL